MGSAKYKSVIAIFIIFILVYSYYLLFDYKNQGSPWIEDFGKTKAVMSQSKNFSAVLLGGSNLAYSLSASQLSQETKLEWFNFGLPSEGYTDKNYWKYIEETIKPEKRDKIRVVVYSTLALYRSGYLKLRNEENRNIWGNRPLGRVPDTPLAVRMRSYLKLSASYENESYPLPTDYGDFNFELKKCNSDYKASFDREQDFGIIEDWLHSQIYEMRGLFPNARFTIVMPSEYYGNYYNANMASLHNSQLIELTKKYNSNGINSFIQKPFSSKSHTCDAIHHASNKGRHIRTSELTKLINSYPKF
jgi:hypothetical protein